MGDDYICRRVEMRPKEIIGTVVIASLTITVAPIVLLAYGAIRLVTMAAVLLIDKDWKSGEL